MLDLYHWEPNTFCLKPMVALHEKGLDFNSHYQDWLAFEQLKSGPKLNVEGVHNFEIEGPILVNGEAGDLGILLHDGISGRRVPEGAAALSRRPPPADGAPARFGRYLGERTGPAVATLGLPQISRAGTQETPPQRSRRNGRAPCRPRSASSAGWRRSRMPTTRTRSRSPKPMAGWPSSGWKRRFNSRNGSCRTVIPPSISRPSPS